MISTDSRPLLTIITAVKSCDSDFDTTIKSLNRLKQNFELVVVATSSNFQNAQEKLKIIFKKRYCVLIEEQSGIYQAFNQGLDAANGELIWFINSGDELVDAPTNLSMPCRIRYTHKGRVYSKLRSLSTGGFYCHNALIFSKNKIRFTLEYKVASDFLYMINNAKSDDFPLLKTGLIKYKEGFSGERHRRRDLEIARILFTERKYLSSLIFLTVVPLKWILKYILAQSSYQPKRC